MARTRHIIANVDKAIEINEARSSMNWREIETVYGADAYKVWKQAGFTGRHAGRRDLTYPK